MKFLETITNLDTEVLIPLNKIKYISRAYQDEWKIKIICDDDDAFEEGFGNDELALEVRFNEIKKLIDAA